MTRIISIPQVHEMPKEVLMARLKKNMGHRLQDLGMAKAGLAEILSMSRMEFQRQWTLKRVPQDTITMMVSGLVVSMDHLLAKTPVNIVRAPRPSEGWKPIVTKWLLDGDRPDYIETVNRLAEHGITMLDQQ